jgi:cytochrome oxidase Cu insertion factor (SCO1/SenC/PrrC family)
MATNYRMKKVPLTGSKSVIIVILVLLSAIMSVTEAPGVTAQARPNSPQKAARYRCPMHPEVTSEKPENCPKCGMKLRLVADTTDAIVKPSEDSNDLRTDERHAVLSSRVPDLKVYDQHGNPKNFYTDLIKGKTVAINFIFTTCTTICPPLTATFRRVQQDLAKGALDVQLVSISVDPTTDTSDRLRAFADKYEAGPGWTFVTGDKADIDSLLQALGAAVADKTDHTPMILIGNDVTGYWTRAYGLSSPAALVKMITEAASRK